MGSETLSGAANGAMMGATFGPVGMAVGAVIGGIFGSKAKKKRKKQQKQLEEQQRRQQYCQTPYNDGYGNGYRSYGREPMDAPTPYYTGGAGGPGAPTEPWPNYRSPFDSTAPGSFGMSGFGSLGGSPYWPPGPTMMPAVAPVMALPQQYRPQYAYPVAMVPGPQMTMGQTVAPAGGGLASGTFNNYGTVVNINVNNNAPFRQMMVG
ncbi:MAG: hypothetical protein IPK79_07425 [Vampirovibrionales bacterium]|nr:hypothetical protein [Vampirovibrionales bacterium]